MIGMDQNSSGSRSASVRHCYVERRLEIAVTAKRQIHVETESVFGVRRLPMLAAVPGAEIEYATPVKTHVIHAQPLAGLLPVLLRDRLHFCNGRNGYIETIPVWVFRLSASRLVIEILALVKLHAAGSVVCPSAHPQLLIVGGCGCVNHNRVHSCHSWGIELVYRTRFLGQFF